MQSTKMSFYESLSNTVLGLVIGFCVVYFAFPWIGVPTTATDALLSNAMFFVTSFVRSYGLRRLFVWIGEK